MNLVIESGFVSSACIFISNNLEQSEIVKLLIDIFGNMSSFPKEKNSENALKMVVQGVLDTILKSYTLNY